MRLATRSGVSAADIALPLPGDGLVPDATVVIDRATVLPVPAERVWPWLVQLGKQRAGWYFPRRLEAVLPYAGLRTLDARFVAVAVGDDVPDWGPGDPVFRAAVVDPPHALVWHSLRDRANGHRWPADPTAPGVLALSWALVLRPRADATVLHLRLRMRVQHRLLGHLGGLVDWVTVALLFRGLRERVTA